MKSLFPAVLNRLFLLTMLVAAGLFTTACQKDDDPEVKDYSGIDDDLITKYLADHTITTAQKQASGLYFLPVTTNSAAVRVTAGTTVSVLYTGHLLDAAGTVFDASSRNGNKPLTFVVGQGQLIAGFDEGVRLMHIGDKAELLMPSRLAYGNSARSGIPANSVLRFEVEVLDYAVIDDNLITAYLTSHTITTAQKQASGLYFLPVSTNPTGVRPVAGSKVSVLYTGHLFDAAGTIFDASSLHGNVPIEFLLGRGQVIAGFDQGISLMRKGEKAELLIPSGLAYGSAGVPPAINTNSVIRFEVELVNVQ